MYFANPNVKKVFNQQYILILLGRFIIRTQINSEKCLSTSYSKII